MKKKDLRRKLMAAFAMLLISTVMMSTTAYAWFVLSTAPEVTGIETQVGANGSLEIVLLNKETRADMSLIRAGLGGGSLQEDQITANNVWGNLIDLGYTEYGLGELMLLPARLDASLNGESYSVDLNKLLAVPDYGYDGRIVRLNHDTASAIYQESDFLYSGAQDYGVRAIGTSDALSPQGSALNSAKTNISTWTKSARTGAQSALSENMEGLFAIILTHVEDSPFTDEHKATLDAMLADLEDVLKYLDSSLRQGLIAYVASEIGDADLFTAARDRILDTNTSLTSLLGEAGSVPEEFAQWAAKLDTMQNNRNLAVSASAEMTDGDYTWEEIKGVMSNIMNMDQLLINGRTMDQLDVNSLMTASMIEMTLAPNSGLFADIADFTDNYLVTTEYIGKDVEMATASAVDPAYLLALAAAVNTLEPADGGEEISALPLTATYGYAIDLAFRCNAAEPDLVLQTRGVQRVYSGSEDGEGTESASGSMQGGGSYMEFTSRDDGFTLEQRLALMDAIRVGFIDDQGAILAIAKLNVTSREVDGDVVKAPLYLYDYSFEADENGQVLVMGERRMTDNLITELEQNVAKAVTAVVWLDGDIVDNTMVSATEAASLDGVLNLQFATSAELVPAEGNSILPYSADMTGLEAAMVAANELVSAGQGTYTNVSWEAFMIAYRRAESVNNNPYASQVEIRNAVAALSEAMAGLAPVSVEALKASAGEVRGMMGTASGQIGAYIIDQGVDGYVAMSEGTEEEILEWQENNVGTIESVNSEWNYRDQGNGITTRLYTDSSWKVLAGALYQAEAVAQDEDATDDQINRALTALKEAQEALEFAVTYLPYEYNGSLYYMAQSETEAEDTYGRWYDAGFNRIFEDVTTLKLDAYAEEAVIAQITQNPYIINTADTAEYITPDMELLTEVFPELRDAEIRSASWGFDTAFFTGGGYTDNYPAIRLDLTDKTGTTVLETTALTADGVVINLSKQITVCDPADGAVINSETGQEITALSLKVGETANISGALKYTDADAVAEPVESYTWASVNRETAAVSGAGTAVIEAAAVGETTIKLTVTTVCGNSYTCDLAVTVTE